jgi:hypothetical protein
MDGDLAVAFNPGDRFYGDLTAHDAVLQSYLRRL